MWIGNWGDGERAQELHEFLLEPVTAARSHRHVHGVRYPEAALAALRGTALRYGGWLANAEVPAAVRRHRVTVHVPRRPYVTALPGIPTIRVFEALACGIPLVSAPWHDAEGLFRPDRISCVARMASEMRAHLGRAAAGRRDGAGAGGSGLETIRSRHTCAHRVDELLAILLRLARAARSSRRRRRMKIAFYGSSLLSSYWNGAATYYRGLLQALAALGHEISFYEPDILDRQQPSRHRAARLVRASSSIRRPMPACAP